MKRIPPGEHDIIYSVRSAIEVDDAIVLTPLADGFCFGVAPRWFEGLLWFSDPLGAAVHTVNLARKMSTLPLPGHSPAGLGFRPDGSLLIVSAHERGVLRYDGESAETLVDLSGDVSADLGDMVVDQLGRAYVGTRESSDGVIVQIDTDATVKIAADGLESPCGMAITADGRTLIVAELTGRRLTAFRIDPDGSLSDRRTFADRLDGPPDGIALDNDGGIWVAMTSAHRFERIAQGGRVTHRIDMGDRSATACTLGGPERRILFLLSSAETACLHATQVHSPGTGLP